MLAAAVYGHIMRTSNDLFIEMLMMFTLYYTFQQIGVEMDLI